MCECGGGLKLVGMREGDSALAQYLVMGGLDTVDNDNCNYPLDCVKCPCNVKRDSVT